MSASTFSVGMPIETVAVQPVRQSEPPCLPNLATPLSVTVAAADLPVRPAVHWDSGALYVAEVGVSTCPVVAPRMFDRLTSDFHPPTPTPNTDMLMVPIHVLPGVIVFGPVMADGTSMLSRLAAAERASGVGTLLVVTGNGVNSTDEGRVATSVVTSGTVIDSVTVVSGAVAAVAGSVVRSAGEIVVGHGSGAVGWGTVGWGTVAMGTAGSSVGDSGAETAGSHGIGGTVVGVGSGTVVVVGTTVEQSTSSTDWAVERGGVRVRRTADNPTAMMKRRIVRRSFAAEP